MHTGKKIYDKITKFIKLSAIWVIKILFAPRHFKVNIFKSTWYAICGGFMPDQVALYNLNMKKLILLICALIFLQTAQAETIKAGISVEHVPKALYGSWRVSAKLDRTNAPRTFKPQSLDFWNLSRLGDIIELNNPMSGANAEISVQTVEGNIVVFSKRKIGAKDPPKSQKGSFRR